MPLKVAAIIVVAISGAGLALGLTLAGDIYRKNAREGRPDLDFFGHIILIVAALAAPLLFLWDYAVVSIAFATGAH